VSARAGTMEALLERFEPVIGLEVHVQLKTESKIFCGCANGYGAPPNTQVCPVCLGFPGVLPVLNQRAVDLAARAALALGCTVHERSIFARKHYFYPDLPKGYQISQYDRPLSTGGRLAFLLDEGTTKAVGITRVHLEEDAGKSTHGPGGTTVDFNRCGVPLIEIVSEPDLRSPREAHLYLTTLKRILQYADVSDCDMEKGSLRCDANVSIRPVGTTALGTKVEIKNMNSFRHVRAALEFEAERQGRALARGERLGQETRLWNPDRGVTLSMRSKEFAHDYRYFPDPDLVPLRPAPAWVAELEAGLPELPQARRLRFVEQYGLPVYDADLLTADRALADYFEEAVRLHPSPKALANWIMSELLRELAGDPAAVTRSPIRPAHLARLVALVDDGTISGKMAKDVFERMARSGEEPDAIVRREGLRQVADEDALRRVVDEVIGANPSAVADYQKGKKQSVAFLVGQVMKATQGKANPALVNRLLVEKLPKV